MAPNAPLLQWPTLCGMAWYLGHPTVVKGAFVTLVRNSYIGRFQSLFGMLGVGSIRGLITIGCFWMRSLLMRSLRRLLRHLLAGKRSKGWFRKSTGVSQNPLIMKRRKQSAKVWWALFPLRLSREGLLSRLLAFFFFFFFLKMWVVVFVGYRVN